MYVPNRRFRIGFHDCFVVFRFEEGVVEETSVIMGAPLVLVGVGRENVGEGLGFKKRMRVNGNE